MDAGRAPARRPLGEHRRTRNPGAGRRTGADSAEVTFDDRTFDSVCRARAPGAGARPAGGHGVADRAARRGHERHRRRTGRADTVRGTPGGGPGRRRDRRGPPGGARLRPRGPGGAGAAGRHGRRGARAQRRRRPGAGPRARSRRTGRRPAASRPRPRPVPGGPCRGARGGPRRPGGRWSPHPEGGGRTGRRGGRDRRGRRPVRAAGLPGTAAGDPPADPRRVGGRGPRPAHRTRAALRARGTRSAGAWRGAPDAARPSAGRHIPASDRGIYRPKD
ncbi:hypothetical protein SGPA1_10214 [Streptomyces misionensis JCM 4497]